MSKKVRLGLIALFVAALVLAIAIPALAKDTDVVKKGPCYPRWLSYDENGEVYDYTYVKGHYVLVRTDTELTKTCSAFVPYGEDFVWAGAKLTWFTFDEVCDYWGKTKSCKKDNLFVLTYEDYPEERTIEDPVTKEILTTTDWTYTAVPTGEVQLIDVYAIP